MLKCLIMNIKSNNTAEPDFKIEPPSTKALKQAFVDSNYHIVARDTLDCVAHMIIAIDNPRDVVEVGLGYLVDKLAVCRADVGFGSPEAEDYIPIAEHCSERTCPPSIVSCCLPNQHDVIQRVWKQAVPVKYEDVDQNAELVELRDAFQAVRCKSMLMQRLFWDGQPVGISCIDHTEKPHRWEPSEVAFMQSFCSLFLAPLAGISSYWHMPQSRMPSESEMQAIRLAAAGKSYKQIAYELNKSIRTIENQLRSARHRLNARNQAELIRKCESWL